MDTRTTTAADLRALIARHRIPLYILAARVGIHPTTLGRMLTERRPLRRGIAAKILAALADDDSVATSRRSAGA